jgi:mannose-6-phosphate isomerase-like protein (cupin superfamily)
VEAGIGRAVLDGKEYNLEDGSAVVIPAGVEHNIINRSKSEPLKVYTIYSPPNHPDGTINKDKAEAIAYENEHHH